MNVLIVPADIPESNRSSLDAFSAPLSPDSWYWALDLLVEGEPFFVIVSGPVSPITLRRI